MLLMMMMMMMMNEHPPSLRDGGGSVALVRRDDLSVDKLNVGVSGPDDELLGVVDDRQDGEAVARERLAVVARADGVGAALLAADVGLAGALALDREAAGRGGREVRVDAEGPRARVVGGVARPLQAGDRPLRSGGHHGLGLGRGNRGCQGGGREDGGDECAGELHIVVVVDGDYIKYYG